jgi:hypothetical protein
MLKGRGELVPRKIYWSGYWDRAFKFELFPKPLSQFFEVSGNQLRGMPARSPQFLITLDKVLKSIDVLSERVIVTCQVF